MCEIPNFSQRPAQVEEDYCVSLMVVTTVGTLFLGSHSLLKVSTTVADSISQTGTASSQRVDRSVTVKNGERYPIPHSWR